MVKEKFQMQSPTNITFDNGHDVQPQTSALSTIHESYKNHLIWEDNTALRWLHGKHMRIIIHTEAIEQSPIQTRRLNSNHKA